MMAMTTTLADDLYEYDALLGEWVKAQQRDPATGRYISGGGSSGSSQPKVERARHPGTGRYLPKETKQPSYTIKKTDPEVKAEAARILGDGADEHTVARALALDTYPGNPDVYMEKVAGGIWVSIHSEGKVTAVRHLIDDENQGGRYIDNHEFFLDKSLQGQGLGTQMFHAQVEAAQAHGFDTIHTMAEGNFHESTDPENPVNGYYTWARLGYNATLSDKQRSRIFRAGFHDVKDLHDLMSRPGAAAWWKRNGGEFEGFFDTRQGSTSRRVLDAYMKSKSR